MPSEHFLSISQILYRIFDVWGVLKSVIFYRFFWPKGNPKILKMEVIMGWTFFQLNYVWSSRIRCPPTFWSQQHLLSSKDKNPDISHPSINTGAYQIRELLKLHMLLHTASAAQQINNYIVQDHRCRDNPNLSHYHPKRDHHPQPPVQFSVSKVTVKTPPLHPVQHPTVQWTSVWTSKNLIMTPQLPSSQRPANFGDPLPP